jgi:hypothetical protein
MAVPEMTKNQNNTNLSATEATAEVFLMAFNALPDESQQAILRRLLAEVDLSLGLQRKSCHKN